MATSGTVTFKTDRDGLINAALRLCGAVDPENASGPTANQITNAAQALNMLVKAWETQGLHLWSRKWGVVFPQYNQGVFVLGGPGPAGDHACLSTPLSGGFVQTTLSASAAGGASTIVVTSITGSLSTAGITPTSITNAYNIGIQLDSGTIQWTTVNGAPSGTTVTLAAVLTGAASSGNVVYCYQTKLFRPLRILAGFIRNTQQSNDTPIRIISRDEYNLFGQKGSRGPSVQLYYDPQLTQGFVYVYPTLSVLTQMLFIEFESPIQDFSASTDDYDLPQEWAEALKFNLAYRIAPEYEVPKVKYAQLKEMALDSLSKIVSWDQESPASVFIQPDAWMYGRSH